MSFEEEEEEEEIIEEFEEELPQTLANLAIMVLDGSGSMNDPGISGKRKSEEVAEAVRKLLHRLKVSTIKHAFYMGLVVFSNKAVDVWGTYRPVTEIDYEEIQPSTSYTGGGLTNIADGLIKARTIADRFYRDFVDKVDPRYLKVLIFVLSDGMHNVSGADPVAIARELNEKYTVLSIAYGNDADRDMLMRIAKSREHFLLTDNPEVLRAFFIRSITTETAIKLG